MILGRGAFYSRTSTCVLFLFSRSCQIFPACLFFFPPECERWGLTSEENILFFTHTLEASVEGQNKNVDRTTRSRRITSQESALYACLGRAGVSHELFLMQRGSERQVVCSGQRVALLSLFLPRIPPGSEL